MSSQYIAATVRTDGDGGGKSAEVDASVFSKSAKPYKTEHYPDVLDYEGRDVHNALDRQSVRELKLMPCVATKMLLRSKDEVDPPEITIHGRRIEIDGEEGAVEPDEEEAAAAGAAHRRTQSTRTSRLQIKYHSRSSSLPVEYEQGTEVMEARIKSRPTSPGAAATAAAAAGGGARRRKSGR